MIEIKDLFAGYGKKTVLEDICISFEKGEFTSIVGVNGCGKSTLIKAMLGFIPNVRGEIRIDGKITSSLSRNEIAKRVSYLAQSRNVPDMTVEQMVLYGRFPHLSYPRRYSQNDRMIAQRSMEQAGVSLFADMPLSSLSGGMRQNAYIAMALAQDTEYIFLDEPTAHLDIAHQIALVKTIRALSESGKCVAAVMHDLPLALTFSDKIAVMDGGKIVMQASAQEVYSSGILEKLLGVKLAVTEDGAYCYRY